MTVQETKLENVSGLLASRNLKVPSLKILQATEQSYRSLLFQPAGPIFADAARIGPLDLEGAEVKSRMLLNLASQQGHHLVVTPEYFTPLKVVIECIRGETFPAAGAIWVLGCESMTPAQLEEFKSATAGICEVFVERDDGASIQGTYFDPVVYLFQTSNLDGVFQRVALVQFKTCPSRDADFFENAHLRTGRTIYKFYDEDSRISLYTIICSDALAVGENNSLRAEITRDSILIHIQLNPKPRHVDYGKYRRDTFSKSPRLTNCDLICLNWARNIEQHDCIGGKGHPWDNIGGSTWYLLKERCSSKDSHIRANESGGLYYTTLGRNWNALLFHYDEAAFALNVPKLFQSGPAVQENNLGPRIENRFIWNPDKNVYEQQEGPPDVEFDSSIDILEVPTQAFDALKRDCDMLAIERAVALSCGLFSGSEGWFKAGDLRNFQMADDEVVPRSTFCQDQSNEARNIRAARVQGVASVFHILSNSNKLPPQISDIKESGSFSINWSLTSPNTNIVSPGKLPALVIYAGFNPIKGAPSDIAKAAYELLRRENGAHRYRVAVCYHDIDGNFRFAPIKELTDIVSGNKSTADIAEA